MPLSKPSRREVLLIAGAGAILMLLVGGASIRHSIVCSAATETDAQEASTALARDALGARLLSLEQEALENQILVRHIISTLDASSGVTKRALNDATKGEFAAAYVDAMMLSNEVDAAFDSDSAPAYEPW